MIQEKKGGGLKEGIEMSKVVNGRAGTPTVGLTSKLCSFSLFYTTSETSDPLQFGCNSGVNSVDACQITKKFLLQQYVNVTSLAFV